MNAKARTARQIIKARSTATRSARKIARRGNGTLGSHILATGATAKEARSIAGSPRETRRSS